MIWKAKMKTINLKQGSQEWHNHRLNFYNASDAAAMLGLSIYESRNDFLKRMAFFDKDVNKFQQKIYDRGHEYEALGRPLAEKIIGEDLFPVVGISNNHPKLSASFDGLTLLENIGFEHKTLNEKIAKVQTIDDLDEQYLIQMEHQLIVSDAEKILFLATKWNGSELIDSRHFWYFSDAVRRAKILNGWRDFEKDLNEYKANYKPEIVTIAKQMDALPVLQVQVKGEVVASNINAYKETAFAVLDSIQTSLKTDQDFVDAGEVVKWCKAAEDKLKNAKANIINQTASIAEVLTIIEQIEKKTANKRLTLSKLIETEKEARKIELINKYRQVINETYTAFQNQTGIAPIKTADNFANEIKNKRNLDTINDALFARTREIVALIELQKSNVLNNLDHLKTFDNSLKGLVNVDRFIIEPTDKFKWLLQASIAEIEAALKARAKLQAEAEAKAKAKAKAEAEAKAKQLKDATTALIKPTNTIAPIEVKNVSKVESLPLFAEPLQPQIEPKKNQWIINKTLGNDDVNNFILAYKYNCNDDDHNIEKTLCDFLDYLTKNA